MEQQELVSIKREQDVNNEIRGEKPEKVVFCSNETVL